jgi:hypothetical protein
MSPVPTNSIVEDLQAAIAQLLLTCAEIEGSIHPCAVGGNDYGQL